MFDYLSSSLSAIFQNITAKKLTPKLIDEHFEKIEEALLQADAPFVVVNQFLSEAKQDVLGEKYNPQLTAQQALVKIIYDRLTNLLSCDNSDLEIKHRPAKILMAGLQGTGKTTCVGKLALYLLKQKKSVLLVSLDVYRPAAREQLAVIAKKLGVDICGLEAELSVVELLQLAMKKSKFYDVLIVDTAGRTQVDEKMMDELHQIYEILNPHESLFVLDSMMGQEALQVAQKFHQHIKITGVIATKMDSDARSGSLLGLKHSLNVPIKFLSSGEHYDKPHTFTKFIPDRMAQRILGMGDLLSLVEHMEATLNKDHAAQMQEKLLKTGEFNYEDMRMQLEQMKSLFESQGGLTGFLKHLPGFSAISQQFSSDQANHAFKQTLAMIQSMTQKERLNPHLMTQPSRKYRVAAGAGVTVEALNRLIKQHKNMQKVMQKFKGKSPQKIMDMFKGQFSDTGGF